MEGLKSCRKCFRCNKRLKSGERFWKWHRHFWNWKNWAEAEEHLGLGNGISNIRSWATEQQQRVEKWKKKKKKLTVLESQNLSLKYSKSSTRKSPILSSKPATRKMDSPSDTFPGFFYFLTLTLISNFFVSSPSPFILLHFFFRHTVNRILNLHVPGIT